MNDYEAYEEIFESADRLDEKGPLFLPQATEEPLISVDFDDPTIASLPRVLLMGPRRGGKTSVQVRNALRIVSCTSFSILGSNLRSMLSALFILSLMVLVFI